VRWQFDSLELLRFISQDFDPMNAMCERADMFERLIYERTRAIFLYFDCRSMRLLLIEPRPRTT